MDFRKLNFEDVDLFTKFFEDNPFQEDEEDVLDHREEIEEELRVHKFQYYGFVDKEKLVAYGKLRCEEDEAHFIGPFVLPEYRRKGIGKKMLDNVETHCRHKGKTRLNAYSYIDTKLAEDFLINSGYELESVSELGVNVYIKKF